MVEASKTRVCIKNLPPTASEQDVKEFLTGTSKQRIEITDCKVLKNAKGKSRKVAFVGFRHESQAKYVIDTFHRVFMGMTRLSVEAALAKKNEEEEPRATGKDEKDKTSAKSEPKNTKQSKHKEEIMKLAGAASVKSKFWANDEAVPATQGDPEPTQKESEEEEGKKDSDDESDSDSSSSDDSGAEEEQEPIAKPKAGSSALSDLDFLRSKQKATDNLEEEVNDESSPLPDAPKQAREEDMQTDSEADDNDDDGDDDSSESSSSSSESVHDVSPKPLETKAVVEEPAEPEDENDNNQDDDLNKEATSNSRMFVRNLPFETTEEELEEYFSAYGPLVECHIPVDDQKRNKGFAFVQYASANDALEARKQLDKVDFQGRLLHILPAKPAPNTNASGGEGKLTWKQSREQARKEQDTKAGGDGTKGWSASFVRGDAVVDNLADRLGLRKADFLAVKDKLSSGDAAVRLALGETQIIEENREYFRQNGIDMEALVSATGNETTAKRSKSSFLVKNLPYDTRVEELNKLFQMGDETVKILLPPSRTIALVEYGHPSDAKRAFRKLAYRRFKHVPIYLEWAPLAARKEGSTTDDNVTTTNTQVIKEPMSETIEDFEADYDEGVSTIYVKNLNFATSEETLRQVFEKNVGPVLSVRIPQKVAPSKSGEESQLMSMGYGFVELESESAVKKAIQVLQGKLVEGHAWEVTISNKKGGATGQKSKSLLASGKNPTKLIVRNVPFQATRTELLKLFGTFGQLRKVRLPKKFDGSHRGFAFVEFLTGKEAAAAMSSLSRTHLYGRHLVLEWATDDDQDLGRLREKAQRDTEATAAAAVPANKKMKFT